MLERAAQKLRLDQLVIQQGRAQQAAKGEHSLGFSSERVLIIRSCGEQRRAPGDDHPWCGQDHQHVRKVCSIILMT